MKKYIKTIGKSILCAGAAFFNMAVITQNTLSPTPDEGAEENEQGNTIKKIVNSLPPTPDYAVRICNSLPPTIDPSLRVIKVQNSLPPTPEKNRVGHQRLFSPVCFYVMQQRQHTRA